MKLPLQDRWTSFAVIAALAAVLIVLGALQYRWSGEASEASAMRMQASMHSSLLSWRQDLYHELAQAGDAFQFFGSGDARATMAEAAQRYREVSRVAAHPALVKNVFAFYGADRNAQLMRLDSSRDAFEPSSLPDDFQQLHQWLERISHDEVFYLRPPHRAEGPGMPPGPVPPERGRTVLRRGPALIAQDVSALVYPVMYGGHPKPNAGRHQAQVVWFIVQLDPRYLTQHLFPELAERYFGGTGRLAYRVAVISVGRNRQLLYSSDPDFGSRDLANAEFTVNIFGPPFGTIATHAGAYMAPPSASRDHALQARTENGEPENGPGMMAGGTAVFTTRGPAPVHLAGMSPFMRFEPIHYGGPPSDWQVVLSNRGGSPEAIAAALRRRNLAISFGVLLVLAATVGVILVASQRAQRLARLQMEFVAAVSHELRTPLTVISSAAENIADGVVENRQQVMRYGDVIKSQARQLIHIVEQVLLFAATREGAHRYHLRTLAVAEIVNSALDTTAGLISAAGVTVEQEIEPHLPPVEGDLVALTQCLQNLVTNAVKYGGDQRWIGVRASLHGQQGHDEIRISVADRGEGIAREDLEHIFQPFYRSVSATSAQIHGTGLGLPLAQAIAEAMNGRITVSSEPGKGSTFALHLPVAAAREEEPAEAVASSKVS